MAYLTWLILANGITGYIFGSLGAFRVPTIDLTIMF